MLYQKRLRFIIPVTSKNCRSRYFRINPCSSNACERFPSVGKQKPSRLVRNYYTYVRDRVLLLEGTLTFPYIRASIWPGKKLKQTHILFIEVGKCQINLIIVLGTN